MKIWFTDAAQSFLKERGETDVTVASLVFSSCCSGPLPPEVKPGAPGDPHGFDTLMAGEIRVYYDSLLDPRPALTIDLKEYGLYQELFLAGWE